MSGVRSQKDRTTSSKPPPAAAAAAVGSGAKAKSSSGTMPSRYVKNTPPSPTISLGSSATLQPDVKLRRTDSKASKSGDSNRRSFLGWFRHKAEPTTSSEAAAKTPNSSSRWKKKDGLSALGRSSHLSDSLPSLVVPTVVHPAIIKHRQRDIDGAAPAAAAAVAANSSAVEAPMPPATDRLRSRFGSVGSKADLPPSSRNRWSSYDIVGGYNSSSSNCSLSVPEEEVAIVVSSTSSTSVDQITAIGRRSDGNGDAALPPQSPNRRSLLQVNSLPVVRTRSAELLSPSQADAADGKSVSATSLTTQVNAGVSTMSSPAHANHDVASPPLLTSTPAGHNDSKRDLIGRLRLTEAKIETSVRLTKRLWAKLLHISDTDFDSVGELARQSSHGDGDARELLLASLIDADRVTSHLNVLLRCSPRPYTPPCDDVTDTVSHPQRSSAAAAPTPLDDVISPQLVDLGNHLHQQLKLLMDAIAARDQEKARLADRLADTRRQLDERRRQHEIQLENAGRAGEPDPLAVSQSTSESSTSDQVAPPGESQQNSATSAVDDETAEVFEKPEEVVESAPLGADGESTPTSSSLDDIAVDDSTNAAVANAVDIHAEQNGSEAASPTTVESPSPSPTLAATTNSPTDDGAPADDAAATDSTSAGNLPSTDGIVSVDAENADSNVCRDAADEIVDGESPTPETGDENIVADGESTKTVLETVVEQVVVANGGGD